MSWAQVAGAVMVLSGTALVLWQVLSVIGAAVLIGAGFGLVLA